MLLIDDVNLSRWNTHEALDIFIKWKTNSLTRNILLIKYNFNEKWLYDLRW